MAFYSNCNCAICNKELNLGGQYDDKTINNYHLCENCFLKSMCTLYDYYIGMGVLGRENLSEQEQDFAKQIINAYAIMFK